MGESHVRFDPLLLDLKGDLIVQGGFSSTVSVSPDTTQDPGNPNSMLPDTIAGNLRVRGGSASDTVLVEEVDGLVDVQLDLGGGDNTATLKRTFVLPHMLEVSGRLSITSGNGDDVFELENVLVSGLTSVNSGGGADRLSIGGVATFDDLCRFNTGAGDDQILIGMLTGASGPVTFQKVMLLNAGAGNDSLSLGVARPPSGNGDQNSRVVFTATGNLCDGFTGRDSFDEAAGQFTLGPNEVFQKVFPSWEV
jgi:hypothetical protein